MSAPLVRPIQEVDRQFVARLYTESERELYEMDPDNSPEPDPVAIGGKVAEAFRTAWSRSTCWIAEVDGRPVGFVIAGPANSPSPSMEKRPKRQLRIGEIHELHVLKGSRRAGVGTALLRHAERQLVDAGFDKIIIRYMAKNEAAARLYSGEGFSSRGILAVKRVRGD